MDDDALRWALMAEQYRGGPIHAATVAAIGPRGRDQS